MADFQQSVAYVLAREGGFVDDPDDDGGATNMGVTMPQLAAFRGHGVTRQDVKDLSVEEARAVYLRNFWEPLGCAWMPQVVATSVLDAAVNQGVSNTKTHVKQAVSQCGQDHPSPNLFLSKFIPLVQNHYVWLVLNEPKDLKFLKGWLARSQLLLGFMV